MNPEITRAILEINADKPFIAQSILVEYLKKNPKDVDGWCCLYSCLFTQDQKQYCLEKIIRLDPHNEHAVLELKVILGGGHTFTDFPIVKRSGNNGVSSMVVEAAPQQTEEEKSLPVYVTKRIIKYNFHEYEEEKQPILKPRIRRAQIKYNTGTAGVLSKIDLDTAMYGNRLILGGMSITPRDYPKCIEKGYILPKSKCNLCEFFSSSDCPILYDPSILEDVKPLFDQNKLYRNEYLERRDIILDALYNELKDHGRPLHYEVLARIMKDRYPHLHLNAKKIVHFMGWHPEKFECVDKGVYQAK
jgi:hypothetical protein